MRKLPPLLIAIFVMITHLNGELVAVNPEIARRAPIERTVWRDKSNN